MNDRHVDPDVAELSGEAAQQRHREQAPTPPTPRREPESLAPDEAVSGDGSGATYYDQPAIKEPVWIWAVPAYFHVGGVAAGAAVIGAVAQCADRDRYTRLINSSRWLAAGGTSLGTLALVYDLGVPSRFLHMLRVFRPTSAMSMGSWTLAASGTTAAASVALTVLPGRAGRALSDLAGLASGALGPLLGTYTAVLVSDTSVPLWQATRRALPPFFASSAMVAATSALDLVPLDPHERTITRRLGLLAKLADTATGLWVQHDADRVGRVGRPLHEGASGGMWRTAKAATLTSLAVSAAPVPQRWQGTQRVTAAVLGTLASMAARFAVFHAGKRSARDPRATFTWQRSGHGALASDGEAAVAGPRGRRAATTTARSDGG